MMTIIQIQNSGRRSVMVPGGIQRRNIDTALNVRMSTKKVQLNYSGPPNRADSIDQKERTVHSRLSDLPYKRWWGTKF